MKLHGNAALSWHGRRRLAERVVEQGWTLKAAAEAAGVSVRCARKWAGRYRLEGESGLRDRSSAPRRVANRTAPERVEAIAKLCRLRFTAAEIAELLQMALSTVSGILKRLGTGRLGRLGLEPAVRYERQRPGELLHSDVKKLGRIEGGAGKRVHGGGKRHYRPTFTDLDGHRRHSVGWAFVHIAIDDYSRLAYAEVLPDQRATTAIGFLRRALAFFRRYGNPGRAAADRQRLRLRLRPARARLPPTRDQTSAHPALPATDQRQGRALHPHTSLRLGLRHHLPLQPGTHRRP
jgi:transposase